MTQQLYAELIFDHPNGRDLAIAELMKLGLDVEILDWVDAYEGVVLTPTVWIKVKGAYDEHKFFHEMAALTERFGGDVVEAGLADPLPAS